MWRQGWGKTRWLSPRLNDQESGWISDQFGRGGAEGNRTPDLCSAIAALSHLSYGPAPCPAKAGSDALTPHPCAGNIRNR